MTQICTNPYQVQPRPRWIFVEKVQYHVSFQAASNYDVSIFEHFFDIFTPPTLSVYFFEQQLNMPRQYDLVVFGATGYTGKLCAEHITTHLPSDLKWALAGRSASKLDAVAAECKALNPNRIQPGKHYHITFKMSITWIPTLFHWTSVDIK